MELDRTELVTLLDRALALLPEETPAVLIERHVRESPHAGIARKLGLCAGNRPFAIDLGNQSAQERYGPVLVAYLRSLAE